jgi:hypothetical protein
MGLFTHNDKLVLFRNRLTEAQTQERREEILRLIAAEEAKEGITAILMGKSKSKDLPQTAPALDRRRKTKC